MLAHIIILVPLISLGSGNLVTLHDAVVTSADTVPTMDLQYHNQDSRGQYNYGYSNPQSSKHESRSLDGITRGSYSYVDPDGVLQSVVYQADAEHGFRVAATNLPVAPSAAFATEKSDQTEDKIEPKSNSKFIEKSDEISTKNEEINTLPDVGEINGHEVQNDKFIHEENQLNDDDNNFRNTPIVQTNTFSLTPSNPNQIKYVLPQAGQMRYVPQYGFRSPSNYHQFGLLPPINQGELYPVIGQPMMVPFSLIPMLGLRNPQDFQYFPKEGFGNYIYGYSNPFNILKKANEKARQRGFE